MTIVLCVSFLSFYRSRQWAFVIFLFHTLLIKQKLHHYQTESEELEDGFGDESDDGRAAVVGEDIPSDQCHDDNVSQDNTDNQDE